MTVVCTSVEEPAGLDSVPVGLGDGPEPELFDSGPDATVAAMAATKTPATATLRNAPLLLSPDSNVTSLLPGPDTTIRRIL
ncbi:unannotated protein [freshwater metagenome]|uniref:Unannotated protein n=1 Tax=freshwater metagenome TaxID=449393 RepID=A0A6J6M689_9ZZZZ